MDEMPILKIPMLEQKSDDALAEMVHSRMMMLEGDFNIESQLWYSLGPTVVSVE